MKHETNTVHPFLIHQTGKEEVEHHDNKLFAGW